MIKIAASFPSRPVASFLLGILISAIGCGGGGGGDGGGPSTGVVTAADLTLAGGDTTSSNRTTSALENPAANLSSEEDALHAVGDGAFEAGFVASGPVNAGLGSLFNNRSCAGCHVGNGRGQPTFGGPGTESQAVLRVSSSSGAEEFPGGPKAVPTYGTQLQDHALFGVTPEAKVTLSWQSINGSYPDGTGYQLRTPNVSVSWLKGNPSSIERSLRTAPAVFGAGLLEAVPEAALLALADPDDSNGDGISGRANYVWDVQSQSAALGRFGRKANTSTLLQQTAAAYAGDIGVGNFLFPVEGAADEVDSATVNATTFYTQTLAVPRAVTSSSPDAVAGFEIFNTIGCESCHKSRLRTGSSPIAALSNQTIHPFTDLLVHDMGPGLADNRGDFLASGAEWRTPPLWGIGVTATILSQTQNYLHDGRGRSLEEAILWHGGEAEAASTNFKNLVAADRSKLIAFLRSL